VYRRGQVYSSTISIEVAGTAASPDIVEE